MSRVPLWSLGLACLWGGAALAAPAPQARPPAPQRAPQPYRAAPPSSRTPQPEATPAPAPAVAEPPADEAGEAAARHFAQGRDLVDTGKLNEGVRALLAAHAASPQPPPETDFYLGMAYDGLGKQDAAILAYRRYLARSPGSINARNVRERLALLESRRDGTPLPVEPDAAAAPPRPAPPRKGPFPPLRVEPEPGSAAPGSPAGRQRADSARPRAGI